MRSRRPKYSPSFLLPQRPLAFLRVLDMSPEPVSEGLESKFCGLCFILAYMCVYAHTRMCSILNTWYSYIYLHIVAPRAGLLSRGFDDLLMPLSYLCQRILWGLILTCLSLLHPSEPSPPGGPCPKNPILSTVLGREV